MECTVVITAAKKKVKKNQEERPNTVFIQVSALSSNDPRRRRTALRERRSLEPKLAHDREQVCFLHGLRQRRRKKRAREPFRPAISTHRDDGHPAVFVRRALDQTSGTFSIN